LLNPGFCVRREIIGSGDELLAEWVAVGDTDHLAQESCGARRSRISGCYRGLLRANERRATKVVLGFFEFEGAEPMLQKWIRDEKEKDCRYDPVIQAKLRREIERLGARSLSYQEIILGCPHEEGIDYPLGEICPECPYWAHRKRPIG
jgi:hypothetical protein